MSRTWAGLALLGSSATLVCCVIPAVLVTLGFGAALAGAISSFPALTLLSEHKAIVYGVAGSLLAVSTYLRSRPEANACPADPVLAEACRKTKRASTLLHRTALALFLFSLFFVFLLPRFLG